MHIMDPQLKRGMLDVLVLAAVLREESYGYKIIEDLRGKMELSDSTLYPILRRLQVNGLLTVRSAEHNGRLRKYYKATDEGRARVTEFMGEWRYVMEIYEFVKREAGL